MQVMYTSTETRSSWARCNQPIEIAFVKFIKLSDNLKSCYLLTCIKTTTITLKKTPKQSHYNDLIKLQNLIQLFKHDFELNIKHFFSKVIFYSLLLKKSVQWVTMRRRQSPLLTMWFLFCAPDSMKHDMRLS